MIPAQDVVEEALSRSGVDELAVIVTETSQVNLRWAANGLTTNGRIRDREVDVVAFHEGDDGVATATASGQARHGDDVRELVRRAGLAAAQAVPADDRMPLVSGRTSSDWEGLPPETDETALESLAHGLGRAFARGAKEGVDHFGYAEQEITTTYLGTTTGIRLRHVQPQGRLEFTAKANSGRFSAWAGVSDTDLNSVDVDRIETELRDSLDLQRRVIPHRPGRYPVLLMPGAVADLMIELYWAADLRSAVEGRSAFASTGGATKIGEQLAATSITLSSDPVDADATMRCAGFETCAAAGASATPFDNGLPLRETRWIENGTLRHLVSTRHTAAANDLPATPGIDNLRLTCDSGVGSAADLVERMGNGLLVSCLWYNRVVDPRTLLLTGLTRDGVYVVRDGEVVGSCGNFRFNESPISVLDRVRDAGTTVRTLAREMGDYFNRAAMPALLIDGFNMSTTSEAQ